MTVADPELKSFLTAFTDRPGAIATGVTLEPYYSAARYKDYYVLTRTIADNEAVRGGMVFTHALILSISDLDVINNLNAIYQLFTRDKPVMFSSLCSITIDSNELDGAVLQTSHPLHVQRVVERLLANHTPVLFSGELGIFEGLTITVWAGLPASFRKNFSFTAAFSPAHIDSTKKLIYVQPTLRESFRSNTDIIDGSDSMANVLSEAEKFILSPNAENDFDKFLQDLQVVLADWSILTPSVRAFQLNKRLDSSITVDELRLLVRNLALISPNPSHGTAIKGKAIEQLAQSIASGTDTNIKSLRNLSLGQFTNGQNELIQAIEKLVDGMFTQSIKLNRELLLDLYQVEPQRKPEGWWQTVIQAALTKCTNLRSNASAMVLWSLMVSDGSAINKIFSYLTQESWAEDFLVANTPSSISPENALILAVAARSRRWYMLHARMISAARRLKEAIIEQYQFEKSTGFSEYLGTKYLLAKINDHDLLALCFEQAEDIFIQSYALRVKDSSGLLADMVTANPIWLRIWAASLELTNVFSHGLKDEKSTVTEVLDSIISGVDIPIVIISKIADGPNADVTYYEKRSLLWAKLPASQRENFLESTAHHFLRSVADGSITNSPEPPLAEAIGTDKILAGFLSEKKGNMLSVINAYEVVPNLQDRLLANYIKFYTGAVNDLLSLRLGDLIRNQKLIQAANEIFEKAKSNNQFRIALSRCKSLLNLSFLDRWFYGHILGEQISTPEIYQQLLNLVILLYNKGPEDRDIWQRAGGQNSKLTNTGSREDSWRYAFKLLGQGGGGNHLTIQTLVKEMLCDYQNNEELKLIARYFNI